MDTPDKYIIYFWNLIKKPLKRVFQNKHKNFMHCFFNDTKCIEYVIFIFAPHLGRIYAVIQHIKSKQFRYCNLENRYTVTTLQMSLILIWSYLQIWKAVISKYNSFHSFILWYSKFWIFTYSQKLFSIKTFMSKTGIWFWIIYLFDYDKFCSEFAWHV